MEEKKYNVADILKELGVGKTTVLRWEKEGKIPLAKRDRMGWRYWSEKEFCEILAIKRSRFQEKTLPKPGNFDLSPDAPRVRSEQFLPALSKTREIKEIRKGRVFDESMLFGLKFGTAAILAGLVLFASSGVANEFAIGMDASWNALIRGVEYSTARLNASGAFIAESASPLYGRGKALDDRIFAFFDGSSDFLAREGFAMRNFYREGGRGLLEGASILKIKASENFSDLKSSIVLMQKSADRSGAALADFMSDFKSAPRFLSALGKINFSLSDFLPDFSLARELKDDWEFVKPDVKALPRGIYGFYANNALLAANIFQNALFGELGEDARMFFVGLGRFIARVFYETDSAVKTVSAPPPSVENKVTQESSRQAPIKGVTVIDNSRIIERIIEKEIHSNVDDEKLQKLERLLFEKISSVEQAFDRKIQGNFNAVAITQRINNLGGSSAPVNDIIVKRIEITESCTGCGTSSSSSGSGTVGSGTLGQVPYYAAAGTTLTATSSIFIANSGYIGIGTTTPYSKLSVWGGSTGTDRLFELTNGASTTLASVLENGTAYFLGNVGIATTSPGSIFSVQGVGNFQSATSTLYTGLVAPGFLATSSGVTITGGSINLSSGATSTFNNGIALSVGCFQMPSGSCLTSSGGDATTLDTLDSTQFLRSDASDSYTSGTLTFSAGTTIALPNIGNNIILSTNSSGNLAGTTTPSFAAIFATSTATSTFAGGISTAGLASSNGLTISGGNLILNSISFSALDGAGLTQTSGALAVGAGTCVTVNANDIAVTGNCVDSTTLDSIDSGSFLRSDASDSYTSGTLTFNSGTILNLANVSASTLLALGNSGNVIASTTPYALSFHATGTAATSTFAGGLTVDGTTLVVDYSSGNVGIGTAAPVSMLDIRGTTKWGIGLGHSQLDATRFFGVTGLTGSWGVDNDASSGFGIITDGESSPWYGQALVFRTHYAGVEGRERMRITATGLVGIGTTTPGSILSIQSVANFQAATSTLYAGLVTPGFLATSSGVTISGGSFLQTNNATNTFGGGLKINTGGLTIATANCSGLSNGGALTTDSSGNVVCSADDGGGGSAAGTDGQIQYNDGGSSFGGASGFIWDDVNLRLGVGSTTPFAKLSLDGNAWLNSNLIQFASTSATTLTVNYLSTATSTIPNNQLYAWTIATSTTASPIFRIDTTSSGAGSVSATTSIKGGFVLDDGAFNYDSYAGNVGIGGINSTSLRLRVRGSGDNNTSGIAISDSDDPIEVNRPDWVIRARDGGCNTADTYGCLRFQSTGDYSTFTTHMLIEASGNVGIGTTSPFAKLSVVGNTALDSNTITYSSSTAANLTFSYQKSATSTIPQLVNAFSIGTTTGPTAPIFSIDGANGRVGIGTANPVAKLHLYKDDDTSAIMMIERGNNLQEAAITLRTAGLSDWIIGERNDFTSDFRIWTFGTLSDALSILRASGNVGIGTTSPFARLSVTGNTVLDSNLITFASSTASRLTLDYRAAATSTIPNNQFYAWTIGTTTTNTPIFRINTALNGSNAVVATTSVIGGFSIDNGAFNYESGSGVTSIDSINTGPMAFGTDAGVITWINLPISTTTTGIVNSYSANIDDVSVLTIYGESGAGSTSNLQRFAVGIASSTPWGTLSVEMGTTSPAFVIGDNGTSSPSFIVSGSGKVGIGTTSPFANLSIYQTNNQNAFAIGSSTTSFIVDEFGRVGIGTAAPEEELEIKALAPALVLRDGNGSNAWFILRNDNNFETSFYAGSEGPTLRYSYVNGDTTLPQFQFIPNTGAGGIYALAITGGGNVGIGTTSPFARLSVTGNTVLDSNLITFASSTASTLTLDYRAAATSTIPNNKFYAWTIGTTTTNTPIFRINTALNGSNATIATTSIIGGFTLDGGAFNYDSFSGVASVDSLSTGPMAFDNDAGILSWMDMPSSTTTAGLYNSYSAQIDSASVLTIFATTTTSGNITKGNVGIGTTTPPWTLTVVGGVCISTGSTCPAAEVNGGLRVDTAGVAGADDPGDVFDIAERYPASEPLGAGEIVALDSATTSKAMVKKASWGETVIGVVSTRPALAINGSEVILGAQQEGTTTRPLIALSGRVPVKVNLDGGVIKKGDKIALSSIPGIGTRATTSGVTIGIALEDFDGGEATSTGSVLAFVNLGWSNLDGNLFSFMDASSSPMVEMGSGRIKANYVLDMDDQDIINVRSILSSSGNWSIDENGKLTVEEIHAKKLCLEDVCVTKEELKNLLDKAGQTAAPILAAPPPETPGVEDSQTPGVDENASSTPPVEPTPEPTPTPADLSAEAPAEEEASAPEGSSTEPVSSAEISP